MAYLRPAAGRLQRCENSFLQVSIKTCRSISDADVIKAQAGESRDGYGHLGVFIDDTLSFDHKTENVQEGTSHIVCIT